MSRAGLLHWFFLAQKFDLPERVIAADTDDFIANAPSTDPPDIGA
jgi:hypothetical protein